MYCHQWNNLMTFVLFIYFCLANVDGSGCHDNKMILAKYQQNNLLINIELPIKKIKDSNLEVCSPPGADVSTCCSNKTENELKVAASIEFKKNILSNTHAFSFLLQENKDLIFNHYRSVTRELVERLERYLTAELQLKSSQLAASRLGASILTLNTSLHIFLHQEVNDKHSEQFLTEHLRRTMENIYDNLFIHSLINPKELEGNSLDFNCIQLIRTKYQLPQLQDLVRKLNLLVIKALSYTRTFMQAINISLNVFNEIRNLPLEDQCTKALAKLAFCQICKSSHNHSSDNQLPINMFYKDPPSGEHIYPCNGFCRNVIGGCLAQVIDVEYNWNMFVQNIKHLFTFIKSNLDFESLASNMPLRITEITKHLKEHSYVYKQKIEEECVVNESFFISPMPLNIDLFDNKEPVTISLQIEDRLKKMSDGKWVFKTFPTILCPQTQMPKCWNGTDFGLYQRIVPNLHIGNQIFRNPEMHISQQPPIDALKDKLEYINKKLQSKLLLPRSNDDFGSGNFDDRDDIIDDYNIESSGDQYYNEYEDEDYAGSGFFTEIGSAKTESKVPTTTIALEDFTFSIESTKKMKTTESPVYINKEKPKLNIPPISVAPISSIICSTIVFAATISTIHFIVI